MKLLRVFLAKHKRVPMKIALYGSLAICALLILSSLNLTANSTTSLGNSQTVGPAVNSYYYSGYTFSPSKAVSYGMMVDTKYLHKDKYPSGQNQSVLQDNMDYYNSEDCAHFVSEALIAGGLTSLASNPPGDNLSSYQQGFPGSYGIVGVYRLVDYLAGYNLPVFSTNSTVENTLGYQPIPASYMGSPHASVFYVTNESLLPGYFLSPGDVVADGGVGAGHAMLYTGNGKVVQTDPAGTWSYVPGEDLNISFYGMDTLNGVNVSALYVHMPTISSKKTVQITALSSSRMLNKSIESLTGPASVKLIGSYPDGVGFGNYSYKWKLNGNVISTSQVTTIELKNGTNHIELQSTGSNGTASDTMTVYVGNVGFRILSFSPTQSLIVTILPIALAATGISTYYFFRKKK